MTRETFVWQTTVLIETKYFLRATELLSSGQTHLTISKNIENLLLLFYQIHLDSLFLCYKMCTQYENRPKGHFSLNKHIICLDPLLNCRRGIIQLPLILQMF